MFSVIIPTLNEAANLPATVAHTLDCAREEPIELIVSDCGSEDGTSHIAKQLGLRVVSGGRCRAEAMNIGASVARGDLLLFLHADSLLPDRFPLCIGRAMSNPRVVGGAFDFTFARDDDTARLDATYLDWVVLCNRLRYRWTGNFYGDQSIFVRRDVFDSIGGFPRVRLFEDVYFSRQLRRRGRTAILRPPVRTSPRRFISNGVVRQFAQDLMLLGCDSLGFNVCAMWDAYSNWNARAGAARAVSAEG
jgi:rSAM/selenodomain-associated transferase 2